MSYDYDIFISFAQSENSGVDIEWSLKFCNLLDNLLNKMTNEKPVIITSADIEARINMFRINREEIYSKSAIFVVILSEDSLNDQEFLDEMNDFSSYLELYRDGLIEKSFRVFKIMSSPVSFSKLPDFLKYETSFNFYETNLINGRTHLFNLSFDSKRDNVFWSRLVDLAYEIADNIKKLRTGNRITFPKETDSIYLAATTPDQEEYRDIIKRDLKQLGYRVLPDFELPEKAVTFYDVVSDLVHKSRYSIHIIGGYYGHYLEECPYSAVEYQNKIVAEYIKSVPENKPFERIIWISSDIKVIDQKQRLYVGRMKRDESISSAEIIECPLEDIKSIIENKIFHRTENKIRKGNKLIFMQYPEKGKTEVENVIAILKNSDEAELVTTEMLEQENIFQTYWDKLVEADILLFFYNGNRFWLDFKIKDALKVRGYQKDQKEMQVIIITEKEDTPVYQEIINYRIIKLNDIQNILTEFVS